MKQFLFIFLLLSIPFLASTQETSTEISSEEMTVPHSRAFGIDASFINRFLPIDKTIGSNGHYLFHYRKYKSTNKYFRMSATLNLIGNIQNRQNDNNAGFFDFRLDYRLGWAKEYDVWKGFQIVSGFDITPEVEYERSTASDATGGDDIVQSVRQIGIGTGPFIGLQYNITPRLLIYTEGFYYLKFLQIADSFDADGIEKVTNNTFRYFTTYALPGNLVLLYKF